MYRMKKKLVGFIGAGNMASAIIGGIRSAGIYEDSQLFVFDVNHCKMAEMKKLGLHTAASAQEMVQVCDIVFLAVKPQNFEEVLTEICSAVTESTLFVTIAAGISTSYIRSKTTKDCQVIRAMPNTPLLLGLGATALCRTENVPDTVFEEVKKIFETSGIVEIIEERQMNEIISVNGSSPAYVYVFVKALVDGAKAYGIDSDVALRLVAQTLTGSAKMLLESGKTPDELIQMVSSPGGTTLAALNVLEKEGFSATLRRAMDSCTARAEELGR